MQRVPGYDPSEYLRELNAEYVHVWEEISKLYVLYFSTVKVLTVVNPQYSYDLMYNSDGALDQALSPRLYQIMRIRVQPPSGGLYQTTKSMQLERPDFIAIGANQNSTPTTTGPYYWVPYGRGNIVWGLPLATGTKLEIYYSFWPLLMTYLSNGTVSSSGTTVTGTDTTFTQILQPDMQAYLPATGGGNPEEVQMELVGGNNQVYRVQSVKSDTELTLATAPQVPFNASPYVLAFLPDIPREHIRVIASLTIVRLYSLLGDDNRVAEWMAIAANDVQMMKDSLMERQGQDPPMKIRFPYGIGRRNRTFMR